MYQGIGVEKFNGRRRVQRGLHRTAERDTGAADDRWTQTLAPAQGHVAQRLRQVRREIRVLG